MKMMTTIATLAVLTSTAQATPLDELCQKRFMRVVTDTFSEDSNPEGWSFDGVSFIEGDGGSPGAFLRSDDLDTFAPRANSAAGQPSSFTGNYRARGVFALTVDFKTFAVSWSPEERPLSVVLINHAGTPEDITDDRYVFFVSPDEIPAPGEDTPDGWVRYQLEVPSDSPTLPSPRSEREGEPGWVAAEGEVFAPAADPDAVWNTVIEDVDEVVFWWHDPRYFAIYQIWDVGMDNAAVATCRDHERE